MCLHYTLGNVFSFMYALLHYHHHIHQLTLILKIVWQCLTVIWSSVIFFLFIFITSINFTRSESLPFTCNSPIYCHGKLLEKAQLAHLFKDSKTFVDLYMIHSPSETLANFNKMMSATQNAPTRDQMKKFLKEHFDETKELENVRLRDYHANPKIFDRIKDPELKAFARELNKLWPVLARKVTKRVYNNPDRHSIEPLPYPFIVPGGRFKEPYYWDTYWTILGLLVCDMPITTRYMLENFFWLIDKYGFVPNGARVYYSRRSQPPLLTAMVGKYIDYTNDYKWLRRKLKYLERELTYWLKHHKQDVRGHLLLRYYVPSLGPRPESYREDIETAKGDSNKFIEIKSAAESGWDFSGRWFWTSDYKYSTNIRDIDVTHVIPVDLNAFFCGAVKKLVEFYNHFNDIKNSRKWTEVLNQIQNGIHDVLWNEEDGVWFDYHFIAKKHRKQFFASNVVPLWTQCLSPEQNLPNTADKVLSYLERNGVLNSPGGIPASLNLTGEQWDFPNAWPPLQSIVIESLELSGSAKAKKEAYKLMDKWVHINLDGFKMTKAMFEKYDAENAGYRGGGGEYDVQKGFGWTNGVALEMIKKYAISMGNACGILKITTTVPILFFYLIFILFIVK